MANNRLPNASPAEDTIVSGSTNISNISGVSSASSYIDPNTTPEGRLPNATPQRRKQKQKPVFLYNESPSSEVLSSAISTPFSSSSASLADKEDYHVDNPIKRQFLTFLQELRNSDDPLTKLCEGHDKPMFMKKTNGYRDNVVFIFPDKIEPLFEDNEVLVTEAEQARFGRTRVTILPNEGAQEQEVGGGQEEEEDENRDQGYVGEVHEEIRVPQAKSAKDRENDETMQFLWHAFQHFLHLDSAKGKDSVESFALLDRIEQLSKKGLRTPSLKAQYEALMLLPVFMAQRF